MKFNQISNLETQISQLNFDPSLSPLLTYSHNSIHNLPTTPFTLTSNPHPQTHSLDSILPPITKYSTPTFKILYYFTIISHYFYLINYTTQTPYYIKFLNKLLKYNINKLNSLLSTNNN